MSRRLTQSSYKRGSTLSTQPAPGSSPGPLSTFYVKLGSALLRTRSRGSLLALFLSALWFPLPRLSTTRRASARLCVSTLPFLFSDACFTWGGSGRRRCATLAKFGRRSYPLPLWTPHLSASFRRVRRAARRLFGAWGAQAALRSSFWFARRLCCLGSCAGLPGRWRSRLQSPSALFAGRL
jgi:hypothetical protein